MGAGSGAGVPVPPLDIGLEDVMGKRRSLHLPAWVMFSPYLFLLVAFGLVPIIVAFQSSLGISMANPDGGLDNYLIVVKDFRFLPALKNVGSFLAIYLPGLTNPGWL